MENPVVELLVVEMSGKTHCVRVHDSVGDLRQKSSLAQNIPLHRTLLVANGTRLDDDSQSLSSLQLFFHHSRIFSLLRFELLAVLKDQSRAHAFSLNGVLIGGDAYDEVLQRLVHFLFFSFSFCAFQISNDASLVTFLSLLGCNDTVLEPRELSLAAPLPECVRQFHSLPSSLLSAKLAFGPVAPLSDSVDGIWCGISVLSKLRDGRNAALVLGDCQGCIYW
jgi:hypothetical protein